MNALYQNSKIYALNKEEGVPVFNPQLRALSCIFLVKSQQDLPPELREMFEKIILALNMSTNDAEVLLYKNSIHTSLTQSKWNANKVIAVGAEVNDLSLQADLQLYKVYDLGSYQFLHVNDALDIYANQGLKTKFWGLLKSMFN